MPLISEIMHQAKFLDKYSDQTTQHVSADLRGTPSFDGSADAGALDKAIKANGVDEATITIILTQKNNAQRQAIKASYQTLTGKPLEESLKKCLSGHYREVVLAMLKTPAEYDAEELRYAIKGMGTDEDALIEILTTRSKIEIISLMEVFIILFPTNDLVQDIKSDTSGYFQQGLLALLECSRSEDSRVNDELVDSDARALYEAGEQKKEVDVPVFIEILTLRNFTHLQKVFQRYQKYSKHDLSKAVDLQLKGDIEKLLTAMVKVASCRPAFFAERIHAGIKGSDRTLIRNIVCRSNIDMNDIRTHYKRMYNTSLRQDILDKTKGDYQTILLALVGGA